MGGGRGAKDSRWVLWVGSGRALGVPLAAVNFVQEQAVAGASSGRRCLRAKGQGRLARSHSQPRLPNVERSSRWGAESREDCPHRLCPVAFESVQVRRPASSAPLFFSFPSFFTCSPRPLALLFHAASLESNAGQAQILLAGHALASILLLCHHLSSYLSIIRPLIAPAHMPSSMYIVRSFVSEYSLWHAARLRMAIRPIVQFASTTHPHVLTAVPWPRVLRHGAAAGNSDARRRRARHQALYCRVAR